MSTITRIALNIARALPAALPQLRGSCSYFASPYHLARIIFGGERRRKANEKRLVLPIPRFCIISVTWRCNLDCAGCYTKSYRRDSELPLPILKRVLQETNDLGSFFYIIVGGEPLMMPAIIDTLSGFNRALFFMFTNGTLLDATHVRKIKAARNILPILSLEGDKSLTDERRGEGVAEKVATAMSQLRAARIPFGFSVMVTHKNLRLVTSRPWLDTLWEAGACFGFLIDYVPVPPDVDTSILLTDADRCYKARAVEKRFYEARPVVLNIPPDEYNAGECQAAGKGMIHINADGYVEPCPFCHYAADNVHEKPLPQILASSFFQALRAQFADRPNPRGECLLFSHLDEVRAIAAGTGAFCTDAPT